MFHCWFFGCCLVYNGFYLIELRSRSNANVKQLTKVWNYCIRRYIPIGTGRKGEFLPWRIVRWTERVRLILRTWKSKHIQINFSHRNKVSKHLSCGIYMTLFNNHLMTHHFNCSVCSYLYELQDTDIWM